MRHPLGGGNLVETVLEWIEKVARDPWLIWALLFAVTFVLEDAAIIAGALAAADGIIGTWGTVLVLYLGIVLSDFALYGTGWMAQRNAWVRAKLEHKHVADAAKWMGRRMILAIIVSRCLPTMRLPTYTACGLFGLSFSKFAATVVLIVGTWTLFLFFVVKVFGMEVLDRAGPYKWPLIIVLSILFIFGPRTIAALKRPPKLGGDEAPKEPGQGQ